VSGSLQITTAQGSAISSGGTPSVDIQDDQAVARVLQRNAADTIDGTCVDLVPVDLQISLAGHGDLAHALTQGYSGASSGRCAGPAASDLVKLTFPARRLPGGDYDLSGTRTFGAGPFTITAVSTLRMIVSRSPIAFPGFPVVPGTWSSSSGINISSKLHPALVEQATYDYRLVRVAGSLTTTFAGEADPMCRPLGACGASGRIDASLAGHGTVEFSGSRRVGHRTGAAAALADLRAGRMAVFDTLGSLSLRETTSETLTATGDACTNRITQPLALATSGFHHGAERVVLGPGPDSSLGFETGADLLRTRCPGPSLQDVAGGGSLAQTTLAAGALGDHRIKLVLSSSRPFSGSAYTGTRAGTIVLMLALVRAHGETRRVNVPPGFPGDGNGGSVSGVVQFGPASGPVVQQSIPVAVSGQLTVDFHGDTAAGCARLGVCGYSGWESWAPSPGASLTLLGSRSHGRLRWNVTLAPNSSGPGPPQTAVTSASVRLTGAGPAGAQQCLDATPTGYQLQLPTQGDSVSFTLGRALPGVLDDRCAGPRLGAITSLLPSPTLALSRIRRGHLLVSLPASGAFSADGFSGTVHSNLALRLAKAGRTSRLSTSSSGHRHHHDWRTFRQLSIAYTAHLSGSVTDRFAGAAKQAACASLGSCGAGGTETFTAPARAVHATMRLYEPGSDPRSWLLGAVGRGTTGHLGAISGFGSASWSGSTAVQAQVAQGTEHC
ncbi:MAG: hypothetical protein ACRDLV_03075, partial [Solirubrobacteraceae bacterium]